MAKQTNIVTKASEFVSNLFKELLPKYMAYHTYRHTEMVAETARKIGKGMKLGEEGIEVVALASWFLDAGYTKTYLGYEEESVRIVTEFLEKEDFPEEKIDLVAGCIRSSKLSQQPRNLLEEIVRDADLFDMGRKSFLEKRELLHFEQEKALGVIYNEREWAQQTLDLLKGHKYFTRFAQEAFGEQHAENIRTLDKKLRRSITPKEEASLPKIGIERKDAHSEPATETIFKILSHTLMMNSSMADHKAQTMIWSNAIIVAGIVGLALRNHENFPQSIAIPAFLLLGVSVLTIFFAVLAVRPKISVGITSSQQIKEKTSDPLFFGNFYKMSYDEFDCGIKEMMNDKDCLYSSITHGSYLNAKAISKKYRYLNLSYSIFMYGLCLTVLTFLVFYLLMTR